jgi:hypothetical protein
MREPDRFNRMPPSGWLSLNVRREPHGKRITPVDTVVSAKAMASGMESLIMGASATAAPDLQHCINAASERSRIPTQIAQPTSE